MADLGKTLIGGDLIVIDNTTLGGSLTYVMGSLGIGTKVPADLLDVAGNIRLSGDIRTRAATLNLCGADGALIPTKVRSLVISTSTSHAADPNNAYIHGNLGLGMTPAQKLDVTGNIRYTGQLMSTHTTLPPFTVVSQAMIPNLNSDMLNGYRSGEIVDVGVLASRYGVVSGCTVTAPGSTNTVVISSGTILLKGIGFRGFSTISIGGLNPGGKYVVFLGGISGTEGGKTLTAGREAVAVGLNDNWPDMAVFTNPIILCRVNVPAGGGYVQASHITPSRTMVNIASSDGYISFLPRDDESVSGDASGWSRKTDRITMKISGNNTELEISNTMQVNSVKLTQNTVSFIQKDLQAQTSTEQNLTAPKIVNWDDANTKKHSHYYDVAHGVGVDKKTITITNPIVIPPLSLRLYINGMRQKRGIDYTDNGTNARVLTLIVEADAVNDNIVIDYDI